MENQENRVKLTPMGKEKFFNCVTDTIGLVRYLDIAGYYLAVSAKKVDGKMEKDVLLHEKKSKEFIPLRFVLEGAGEVQKKGCCKGLKGTEAEDEEEAMMNLLISGSFDATISRYLLNNPTSLIMILQTQQKKLKEMGVELNFTDGMSEDLRKTLGNLKNLEGAIDNLLKGLR